MKTTALTVLLLTYLATGGPPLPGSPAAPNSEPEIAIAGSADQVALTQDALAMFEAAGLPLPSLTITFHEHRSGCRGHNGVFRMIDAVGEIEICRSTRYLVLHELAHAWEALTMTDDMRNRVTTFWDVDNWNDHDQSPTARGAEKAANAVAFALDEPPAEPNETMRRNLCTYRMITGNEVPGSVFDCPELADDGSA